MQRTCLSWLVPAFLAGLLAVGTPYWLLPYRAAEPPGAFVNPALLAPGLFALLLVLLRLATTRLAIGVMAACVPAAIALRVAVEAIRDPTAHNLWPFELVVGALLGVAVAVPGAVLGLLLRWAREGG
jgi:hypothetical protein